MVVAAQHVVTRGDDGNVISIHGTLQDVTAAKQAELKLKQYSDHLEELVREKSNELFAAQMATIQALVKLAESRDDETGDHIERMAKYCHALTVALRRAARTLRRSTMPSCVTSLWQAPCTISGR